MENRKLQRIIDLIRENMVVGAGGFTGSADPKGPVAGFDPTMKLDGRSKTMRRLPPEYRKDLISKKKGK